MSNLIRYLFSIFGSIAAVYAFFSGLGDWVKDFVLRQVPNFMWAAMPVSVTEKLSPETVEDLAQIIGEVNWFIPFFGLITVYLAGVAAAFTVLLLRYIFGYFVGG